MSIETAGKQFIWASDYVDLPDNDEAFLVKPLLPSGGLANFYGKPKTAKSFAAIGIAIAVSSGASQWNGFPVERHGPVLYVQLDTPRFEWKRRFRNAKAAGYDISKIAIVDLGVSPYPFNALTPQHQTWLKLQIEAVQPVLVVIDTLREAHEGDENDSTDMKKIVNALVAICRPAAVIFVSHSRKDSAFNAMGAESDLMDEGRGSSYVSGRMDTIVRFTGKKGKGHMSYKGRAVEEDRIPIEQDGPTGLPLLEGTRAKQEAAILASIAAHPEWTVNRRADHLVATKVFASKSSAVRWITKLSGDVTDDTT
jgi:RecA-family ATPase